MLSDCDGVDAGLSVALPLGVVICERVGLPDWLVLGICVAVCVSLGVDVEDGVAACENVWLCVFEMEAV